MRLKKKTYCCLQMEDAIIRGSIREENIIHDKPDYDAYVAEFVTNKTVTKKMIFFKKERIDTKDIILKHCIFCGKELYNG